MKKKKSSELEERTEVTLCDSCDHALTDSNGWFCQELNRTIFHANLCDQYKPKAKEEVPCLTDK